MKLGCVTSAKNAAPGNLALLSMMALAISDLGAAAGFQSARFPEFQYPLALALQGKVDEAVPFYLEGRRQKPELDTALVLADLIGAGCANEGLFQQRITLARKELQTGIQTGKSARSSPPQK
jgi:hypothetical protein